MTSFRGGEHAQVSVILSKVLGKHFQWCSTSAAWTWPTLIPAGCLVTSIQKIKKMKLSDFSKVFLYIIIQHCPIYFKVCRVLRQYRSVIFNKPYHAWFSEWIIRPRLTAAVLKCTQVHLPFIFKGFSPVRKTWLWSVLQKLNVIHHTFVYKVHKMDLSTRNREGSIACETM